MAELLTLGIFVAGLFLSLGFGVPLLVALLFGLAVFFTYGLWKKYSFRQLLHMAFTGIKTVKNILITFILIGMLTALWRAGGTIPFIVYHSIPFCDPRVIVLATFLLCCLISVLTGTAFGAAATMGVICVTIALDPETGQQDLANFRAEGWHVPADLTAEEKIKMLKVLEK